MVHIPTTERQFTQVPKKLNTFAAYSQALQPAVNKAAEVGMKLYEDSEKQKMESLGLDARLRMNEVTDQWRKDNQSNPTDANALRDLKFQYDTIANEYRGQISPLFRKEWDIQVNKLKGSFDLSNQTWGLQQREANSKRYVTEDMKKYSNIAYTYGQSGDIQSAVVDFDQSYERMLEYGANNLGAETAAAMLSDYKENYYKNFLTGMSESNPSGALSLLKSKDVADAFEPHEKMKMQKYLESRQKQVAKQTFVSDISNFTSNPTKQTYDSLMAKYPTMKDTQKTVLKNLWEQSPNYEAETEFDSLSAIDDTISSFASGSFEDENEAFNKYCDIVKGIMDANKRGVLSEEEAKSKYQDAIDVLQSEAVRNAWSQIKPDMDEFSKQMFSLTIPTVSRGIKISKLRSMANEGMRLASTYIRTGDIEGARKVYSETRRNMVLYKNPKLQGKKIGDTITINGRVYTYKGDDGVEPILEQ